MACRGVEKTFGTGAAATQALRGIDLDVAYGELLMLVGPSGSGKTTLVSVIAALLPQDRGDCLVLGQDLRAMGKKDRALFRGRSMGFVFQAFNLLPALDATENVSLPLIIAGQRRRDAQKVAADLLDLVGLGGRAHARPRELSGGQQQRVAIARALVHKPKLILCDEPTSNLDHDSGQAIMDLLIHTARAPDRAVVVVTHDPRIFGFADRLARIEDGRIVRTDSPRPAPAPGGQA
ncbi:MAG: ABC transporter ATP-binding protein [Oligoflexia bacterium]|nr:ABC transporter ATP-binding protein [Oligoflexia bacterium]